MERRRRKRRRAVDRGMSKTFRPSVVPLSVGRRMRRYEILSESDFSFFSFCLWWSILVLERERERERERESTTAFHGITCGST